MLLHLHLKIAFDDITNLLAATTVAHVPTRQEMHFNFQLLRTQLQLSEAQRLGDIVQEFALTAYQTHVQLERLEILKVALPTEPAIGLSSESVCLGSVRLKRKYGGPIGTENRKGIAVIIDTEIDIEDEGNVTYSVNVSRLRSSHEATLDTWGHARLGSQLECVAFVDYSHVSSL